MPADIQIKCAASWFDLLTFSSVRLVRTSLWGPLGGGTLGDLKISPDPSSLKKINPNWSSHHLRLGSTGLTMYSPFGCVHSAQGLASAGPRQGPTWHLYKKYWFFYISKILKYKAIKLLFFIYKLIVGKLSELTLDSLESSCLNENWVKNKRDLAELSHFNKLFAFQTI